MASTIPNSQHIAIEIDDGVVSAAQHCHPLRHSVSSSCTGRVELQLGDALTYQRHTSDQTNHGSNSTNGMERNNTYDIVFVDIFDGDNVLPKEFYARSFLEHIQQNLLGGCPDGMVIHNFHTGGKKLAAQLQDAVKAYRSVFSTALAVESMDSRHTGGNTILLAMNKSRIDATSETLSWRQAGRKAQRRWGSGFDVVARTTHKLWFS